MADIDREKFAYAVAGRLKELGLSYSQAQAKYKGITKGLLSRVKNGTTINAANMLVLCRHLNLDPLDYLDLDARNIHCTFGRPHRQRKSIGSIIRNLPVKSESSTLC